MSFFELLKANKLKIKAQLVSNNPMSRKERLAGILTDWITANTYAMAMLCLLLLGRFLMQLAGVQSLASAVIAWTMSLTIMLPLWLYFSFVEVKYATSLGKQFMQMIIASPHPLTLGKSLLRNFFKLLPWHGLMLLLVFRRQLTPWQLVLGIVLAVLYILVLLLMSLYKADRRHWIDLLVGTQVQFLRDNQSL